MLYHQTYDLAQPDLLRYNGTDGHCWQGCAAAWYVPSLCDGNGTEPPCIVGTADAAAAAAVAVTRAWPRTVTFSNIRQAQEGGMLVATARLATSFTLTLTPTEE